MMPALLDLVRVQTVLAADQTRIDDYARAWRAYHGLWPDPLRQLPGEPRDAIKVNRIRPVVNATVHFLFGQAPEVDFPAPEAPRKNAVRRRLVKLARRVKAAQAAALEAWVDECLRVNNWEAFLLALGINGAVCGTAYVRLMPPKVRGGFPRFYALNPSEMTITWDPRDMDEVQAYTWQFNAGPRMERQVIRRKGAAWEIIDQHADGANAQFWETDTVTPWPLPWPPILHCQNLIDPNGVYGLPDVTPTLIDLNAARNFNLTNRNRIDRYHGNPWVWVKNMTGRRVDRAIDKMLDLGTNGEIGQLTPAINSEAPANLGRELDEAICEESGTPSIVLGRADQAGDPSGVALRIKYGPLLTKTEAKRALYGPLLVELIRCLCELGGKGATCVPVLTWPELLPSDPVEERTALQMELDMGVLSKATAAALLGRDWDEEQANIATEAPPPAPPPTPDIPGMLPATDQPEDR